MALNARLGSALTATTNPAATSLSIQNPFLVTPPTTPPTRSTRIGVTDINPDWITQAQPGLFPHTAKDGAGNYPITVRFIPSVGGATYTITVWLYDAFEGSWSTPQDDGTIMYTGDKIDYINFPDFDAIFLQIVSISSGSLSINFDASVALKF